jgi:ubiquinone/menaquinone biosynthesis C-methylase UbiE
MAGMGRACRGFVTKMKDRKLQQIARALYYGPIPALTVGPSDFVADYNLALETVFGDVLSGLRYLPLRKSLELLSSRVTNGALIPEEDNRQTNAECCVDSPHIGQLRLIPSAVVCRDPVNGEQLGQVLFWDVVLPPGNDSFHESYREMLDHQLIWDTYAWSYDRILPLMPYYEDVLTRHAAALIGCFEGSVIDLGAGTGNLAERLIAAGRSVTAVDSSRAMLEKLRSKQILASVLGTRLAVLEAKAESLPMLDDESHAGVSLQLALFDMRSPELGLRSAVRVLRPGGRIVVTDLRRKFQLEPILQECERRLRSLGLYENLLADLQRVVVSNHNLAPGSRSSFRIEDVFDSLAAQGFQDLSINDSHLGQCATVIGQKPHNPGRVGSLSSLL